MGLLFRYAKGSWRHIRLPLAVALPSGLRQSDIFMAPLAALHDGDIAVRTGKRDTPIRSPIHPALADGLAKQPKSDATGIGVSGEAKPWKTSFNASWAKFRTGPLAEGKIGEGLTLRGPRHRLGTMLKEPACPAQQ